MMRRKAKGSVFGPAEFSEGLLEAGKRQANDVEVTAFDAGNVTAGAALDAISTGFVARLAKNAAVQGYFRVGGNDDGRAHRANGDKVRLGVSQALNEIVRGFARVRRFVDGGGKHREMEPSIAKNPGAARRSGSENELHAGDPRLFPGFTIES